MAKKINVEVNFDTADAQKNVKDLDKDLQDLGNTADDMENKVKGAGGGAEKSGKDAKKGSKGWNMFGKALRMTGIGALVGMLFKFSEVLMGNQRVMDTVNTAANTMSIIFSDLINLVVDGINTVIDWVSNLGSLGDMFNNVKEKVFDFGGTIKTYITDAVKKTIEGIGLLGQAVSKVFKGEFKEAGELAKEGVKTLWNANPVVDLTKKTVEYGKELGGKLVDGIVKATVETGKYLKKTYEQGKAIVDTENKLTKLIGKLEQERVAIQKNIDEKTKLRDNENRTFEERKQAVQELLKLEADLLQNEIDLQQARVDNLQAELRVNEDNLQMQQDLALAQAKLTELKNQDVKQITEQTQAFHDLTVAQTQSIREIEMLSKFGRERELAELDVFYKEQTEKARKAGVDQAKITEIYEEKKKQIRKKYNDITIKSAGDLLGALASGQKQGSKSWKKLATAQALINTYLGVTKALSDKEMPFVARMLNAGTQLIMGLNNVKKIKQTKMEGSGGEGSASGGGGGASTPTINPTEFIGDVGNLVPNQLTEDVAGTEAQPVQAYVVERDISGIQALQEELNLQSTL
tara:strand:+ start:206 stop:1936 length:1731 start_codon:yes stop_codon:yes gene_type:complete